MITLCRAGQRQHDRFRLHEVWHTFHRDGTLSAGFGDLALLQESRLPPGAEVQATRDRDSEVVSYVRDGSLSYEDSVGHTGIVRAGEFERSSIRAGLRHREKNASRTQWAQVFHLWLRSQPETAIKPHEQKRFSAADRHGALCVVASADSRKGSLRLDQDATLYSALLDPGQHVILELAPGRGAWLHVVEGEVTLGEVPLTTGDGAGVSGTLAISLTALTTAEILLADVGGELPAEAAAVS